MASDIRVLLVDDDPVDLELTQRLMTGTRTRCRIETAERLEQALPLIRERDFDVLLLDLTLAGSEGLATVDAVRRQHDGLPIIVLTGLRDEEVALQSLDHGAQDYVVKGTVTADALAKSMRYAIQRQQLVQELRYAKALLEQKNRKLGELCETAHRFVDNVSHEFRTPLAVISEYTALMREGFVGPLTEEQGEFLDIVSDRADDLNTMVDDMLDVSKLEAGLLGVWRANHRVADIVDRLRSPLERKAAVKGVRLQIDVADDLPEVYCDHEKVGRVIINLVVNAIKFCGEKGHVRLWAEGDPTSGGVMIGVTDNGPGIDEANLTKIFQRFRQFDTGVRTSCAGFGLGLNIAKELVDLNLAEMDVHSQLGRGSTFTFRLPPADPLEVMRRYLRRVESLRDSSTQVSLVIAGVREAVEPDVLEDVDACLQGLLRRNDLIFRAGPTRWLVVLAIRPEELECYYDRVHRAFAETSRNRIHGPLPNVELQTLGSWHPADERDAVLDTVVELTDSQESAHAEAAMCVNC